MENYRIRISKEKNQSIESIITNYLGYRNTTEKRMGEVTGAGNNLMVE